MRKLDARARTTEVDDVSDRLLVLYRKETKLQTDTFLKEVFAEIETLSAQITEAIKRDLVFSKLEDADLQRDHIVRSLHNVLVGYRSMSVASLKEHGEKLYAVFSKYGVKITKESYATESSLIESLLQDLSAADLQSAIGGLSGVSELITELRTAQTAFNELRAEYEKALSVQKTGMSASALKKPLLEAINAKLITYLAAMRIAKAADYEAFAKAISQTIEMTNTAIKRRSSNKE